MTIVKPFKKYAEQHPNKPAIVTANKTVTYSDFYKRLNRTANALLENRVKSGLAKSDHRVALLLGNRIEFLEVFLAAAAIGSVAVVLDTKWTGADLSREISECGPSMIVTESTYCEKLKPCPKDIPTVRVDGENKGTWLQTFSDDSPKVDVSGDDLFYMGYTSGTTGNPKGFLRTQNSWVQTFAVSDIEFGITGSDHILCPGPFVHSLSLYVAVYTLFNGAVFYLEPSFQVAKLTKLLQAHPISVLYIVPTMLNMILRRNQPFSPLALRKVISSGDKLEESAKSQFTSIFPEVDLYEFYGASELSFVTVLDPYGQRKNPDSVGRPFGNVSTSIRDEGGNEVALGEIGTLYVKSPMVFSRYFKNPKETASVFQNGWATVGDLAWEDAGGYIYLAGRKKNMIIAGGLNIYPEEVEKVILQSPDILEAVVVGVKDDLRGEKVVAAVTGKNIKRMDAGELKQLCIRNLPRYKCPKDIYHFEEFPYTSSGKIARSQVKQMLLKREEVRHGGSGGGCSKKNSNRQSRGDVSSYAAGTTGSNGHSGHSG